MRRCGVSCYHKGWNILCERGGGSKPQPAQFIQAPAPTITQAPAPNIQQNAADLYQAQLQYNPQLTAQAAQLQQQYGPQLAKSQADIQTQLAPQLAQSQYDVQAQYAPLYRSLYQQTLPTQTAGLEQLAQQANQRFTSPMGLTPQQQAAQDAIRQRAYDESARGIRSAANVGGTLYGGQSQLREDRARNELAQGFATQDIGLAQQNRDQALREFVASQQAFFPSISQPNAPQGQASQFGQGVTPSPDNLLQAFLQGQIVQQPTYQPGNPGTPGYFQSMLRGFGGQPGGF